jgi:hypothetical protein
MELTREIPDTALAPSFDGEPLVQSFAVASPPGRVWITTAEALSVPGFGRPWVEARLLELRAELASAAFASALANGVRLRVAAPAALALAA